MIAAAAVPVLIVAPLLLGLAGIARARHAPSGPATPCNWKLTIVSALLYTLAFNLIHFIQELFLVLPKALTPGPQRESRRRCGCRIDHLSAGCVVLLRLIFQFLLRPGISFY